MADKRRFIDVWIVESNTVYREVPFTVVADWIQQGRLLETDMIKPSGTPQWGPISGSTDFNVYLPKPEPNRSEDRAEALERVELDFVYRHKHEEEDDDVDMIPLIDVSLVLLIFFMLISAGASAASPVKVPDSEWPNVAQITPEEVTINVDLRDGGVLFSVGKGNKPPVEADDRDIESYDALKGRILANLPESGSVEVTINANKDVQHGLIRQLTADLGHAPFRGKVSRVLIGVNQKP